MAEKTYSVICQNIVGNTENGFSTVYGVDDDRFDTRQKAIDHGFTFDRSDDFNIGVWEGDKLVSLDWMDRVVTADKRQLRRIQYDREIRI